MHDSRLFLRHVLDIIELMFWFVVDLTFCDLSPEIAGDLFILKLHKKIKP